MELTFKQIELCDKDKITKIFFSENRIYCENTFGTIFCWSGVSGYKVAFIDGGMVLGNPDKKVFDMPMGDCNKQAVVEYLINTYGQISLKSVRECDFNILNTIGGFEIEEHCSFFDYIYDSEKLITLSGKKLATKRNHINAFVADGKWHTKPIEQSDIPTLLEFNKKWCEGRCENADKYLKMELCAAEIALNNFDKMGLLGLMLYKNNTLVAYSYGEPISKKAFCVHVEKADADVRGAYQMINREFAKTYCKDYPYINREDDAGDEGLARAKKSYYPTELGKKFKARYVK